VDPSDQIHIELEIERDAVPLTGRATGDWGESRSFVGWTGLAAILTALLDEVERPGPSSEP
jgi:hypothetical protein